MYGEFLDCDMEKYINAPGMNCSISVEVPLLKDLPRNKMMFRSLGISLTGFVIGLPAM
jgi:hypothetical protein